MDKDDTQCKCGHIYYIGWLDCPMCKLDEEHRKEDTDG